MQRRRRRRRRSFLFQLTQTSLERMVVTYMKTWPLMRQTLEQCTWKTTSSQPPCASYRGRRRPLLQQTQMMAGTLTQRLMCVRQRLLPCTPLASAQVAGILGLDTLLLQTGDGTDTLVRSTSLMVAHHKQEHSGSLQSPFPVLH